MELLLKGNGNTYKIVLNDSDTAKVIFENLPVKGKIKTWGEEIYFPVDLEVEVEEDAKEVVNVGDVCFWPNGQSIAIFFGPTPMSNTNEPRAADLVNVFGKIDGETDSLKSFKDGDEVELIKSNS